MNKSTVSNNNNNQSVLNSNQKLLQKDRIPTISFKSTNQEKRTFLKVLACKFLLNQYRQRNKMK